jgi:hypothetical protein
VAALTGLGAAIQRFIDSGPAPPALFGYLLAAALPVALLHELGHALVAARRSGSPVRISPGSTRHLLRAQLRRARLNASLLAPSGSAGGPASFDAARARARDLTLVALGGPVASLAGFAAAASGLAASAGGGSLHDLLWAATVLGFIAALSVVPLEVQQRKSGAHLRTDGRVALEAVRARRALSSPASPSSLPHGRGRRTAPLRP